MIRQKHFPLVLIVLIFLTASCSGGVDNNADVVKLDHLFNKIRESTARYTEDVNDDGWQEAGLFHKPFGQIHGIQDGCERTEPREGYQLASL